MFRNKRKKRVRQKSRSGACESNVRACERGIPGAPLTNFNNGGGGGGVQQRFIFYTQKRSQLQYLSTQKNHYFFEHTQKNTLVLFLQPKKIPPFFSRPQKIMASFIDPKKSPLAKISDPKNHSEPPVIKVCEWGPWGVQKYRAV